MDFMQFRDYMFRHNPEKISVKTGAALAEHFCPGKGGVTQDMGQKPREIKCEGCFTGNDMSEALAEAYEFRRKCGEKPGVLRIPGIEPMNARLREFALALSGDGRIIPYTLLFLEEDRV